MQRAQLIHTWLEQGFQNTNFKINYLAGDASFRRYARILFNGQSYMLMDAPPEKEDCNPFVQIASYLAKYDVRVPKIIAQDLTQGLLLLEDFGDDILSLHLSQTSVESYYHQAFEQIIHLQSIVPDEKLFPQYDAQKLVTEMMLFSDWLLPSLGIELSQIHAELVQRCHQVVVENILAQPQVIVHRDYHSRNLMVLKNEKNLGIIDFQDAVVGADTYDLISIVRDAYVQWPVAQVARWIEDFYQLLPAEAREGRPLFQFKLDVDLMSIQRHLKVLGIFVRLSRRDGKNGYLKDLPRVMWYLRQELKQCVMLSDFAQFIESIVMPKFVEVYGDYTEVVA